jgi:Arc/MetJ-type ribon-helix-helix transcriptional regulator
MQIQLSKPELQQFIDEEVRSGNFPTAEAAIEAAIEQMMSGRELTEEDWRAIEQADAEMDRGEYIEFDQWAAEMRQKYGVK